MKLKQAFNRLSWRITSLKNKNQTDIDALKTVAEFIDKTDKLNDYQLFAKIYVTFYGELLQYYKTSVFDPSPQKDLHRLLDQSWERTVEKFVKKANDMEVYVRFKEAGISDKHPMLKTDEEKKKDLEKFKLEFTDPIMTYEDAEQNLKALINLAINKYA